MKSLYLIVAALAAGSVASAQSFTVVPNANATLAGTASPFDTLTREFGRSYQQVFAAAELAIPVGNRITGITFRSSNFPAANLTGTWPPANLNWADYEIYLGQSAVAVGLMSTTYAANVVPGTEIQVRDGAFMIPANSWSNTVLPPAANPWGFEIGVTPFVYNGGDLVMTVRHSGHAVVGTPRNFVDVVLNPTLPSTQCMANSTMAATTGTLIQSAPAIVRFKHEAGTCYPDCNGDQALTIADFACFQSKFVAQDPYADCNGDTAFTIADFACFQTEFVAGCP